MDRTRRTLLASVGAGTATLAGGCLGIGGSGGGDGGGGEGSTSTNSTGTPLAPKYDSLTVRVTYEGAWMATLRYHNRIGDEVETPIDGEAGVKTTELTIPDDLRNPEQVGAVRPPIVVAGPKHASDGVSESNPIAVEILLEGEVVKTGEFTSMEKKEIAYEE